MRARSARRCSGVLIQRRSHAVTRFQTLVIVATKSEHVASSVDHAVQHPASAASSSQGGIPREEAREECGARSHPCGVVALPEDPADIVCKVPHGDVRHTAFLKRHQRRSPLDKRQQTLSRERYQAPARRSARSAAGHGTKCLSSSSGRPMDHPTALGAGRRLTPCEAGGIEPVTDDLVGLFGPGLEVAGPEARRHGVAPFIGRFAP